MIDFGVPVKLSRSNSKSCIAFSSKDVHREGEETLVLFPAPTPFKSLT